MPQPAAMPPAEGEVSAEALKRAEEFVEEEEGHANKLGSALGVFVTLLAVAIALFHLYTAYAIVPTQTLRPLHVAMVLSLCFVAFPIAARYRHRIMWWDWALVALSVAIVVYLILGGDDFTDRNTSPEPLDIAFGVALMALVMEAMRRTTGWIMPAIT